MTAFVPIFDGDHLRASHSQGTRPMVMATFDYRKIGRTDFTPANHSSGYARQGFGQLTVRTRLNDWFINPDTEALESALAGAAAPYRRRQALGYSMGGYGVLRFAAALGLQAAVLVSPQVSIAPGVVPFDRRYLAEGRGFDPVLGDLGPRAVPGMAGLILIDPFVRADLIHARMIQALFPRLSVLRLNFGGHPSIRVLRAEGKAGLVQREAALPRMTGTAIRQAHRDGRRGSAGYWERLARHAAARRPALAALARARAAALVPVAGDGEGD